MKKWIYLVLIILTSIELTNAQSNWVKQNSGTTAVLTYVDFIDNNTGLVVGGQGIILKTTDGGQNWIKINSGTSQNLATVCFVNNNVAYISGDNGLILKSSDGGNNWSGLNTGVSYMLYSVDFVTPNIGYAAGMGGVIIKTINGGTTWTMQNSGFSNHIYRINFLNKDTGFVAANSGLSARTIDGGQTWSVLNTSTSNDLSYVKFYDKNVGFIIGDNGTILKSTNSGVSWSAKNSGTSVYLNNVQIIDINTAYAVGANGIILKTTNGGQSWVNNNSGTSDRLVSISFPSASVGYAVGFNGNILKLGVAISSITGNQIVCRGQKNVSFSILPNSEFSSYSWNYSGTGMTMTTNLNSILADFENDATSGTLSVTVTGENIGTLTSKIDITVNQIPSDAGIINGETEVCGNSNGVAYSVPLIKSASNYIWNYSGTGVTVNGNTNNIYLNFSQNATDGILTVKGRNSCGDGNISQQLPITVKSLPSDAGQIVGTHEVCSNQGNIIYSIPMIQNATDYIWNYTGTETTMLENKDSVSIYFFNNATSGNLTVYGKNSCGNGAVSQNFPIIVKSCDQNHEDLINIPNAFTPNGDGVNDFFIIKGLPANTKVMIFDRFGKLLYESNDYANNWDGKDLDGHALESGIYWYVISIPGLPGEYKGFVYIKR